MDTGVVIVEVDFGELAPQPARDTISTPHAEKKRGKPLGRLGRHWAWMHILFNFVFNI